MLTITLNSQDVERGLNQLLGNLRHRQPMMHGIAAELLSLTEDNFENESWGNDNSPPVSTPLPTIKPPKSVQTKSTPPSTTSVATSTPKTLPT